MVPSTDPVAGLPVDAAAAVVAAGSAGPTLSSTFLVMITSVFTDFALVFVPVTVVVVAKVTANW